MDHKQALENLIYSYAERIDGGDFEGVADLFGHAVILDTSDTIVADGREGALALYRATTRLYEDGTPHTRHVTTNLILEIDEARGTATGRSYFTVFQALDDFPLQAIIAGRYLDRFEYVQDNWRFSQRKLLPEQIGDLSRHLLIELP